MSDTGNTPTIICPRCTTPYPYGYGHECGPDGVKVTPPPAQHEHVYAIRLDVADVDPDAFMRALIDAARAAKPDGAA